MRWSPLRSLLFTISLVSCFVCAAPTKALAAINKLDGYDPYINLNSSESAVQNYGGNRATNVYVENDYLRTTSTNVEQGHSESVINNKLGMSISSWNASNYTYVSVVYRSGAPIVKKGNKLYFFWAGYPCGLAYGTASQTEMPWVVSSNMYLTYQHVWTSDGTNWYQETVDDDGYITFSRNSYWLCFTARLNNNSSTLNYPRMFFMNAPRLYYLEDGTQSIENQTQELMSTDGSDTITNAPNQYVSTITGRLGFIQQAGEAVTGIYDAIFESEAQGTVHFNGISWNGFVIPSADVSVLGYFSPEVERTIKTGTTMIFVLAWLTGMKRLYARIFLGEKDVIVDGEE